MEKILFQYVRYEIDPSDQQGRRRRLFFENSERPMAFILALPVDGPGICAMDFNMGEFYNFNIAISRADDVYAMGLQKKQYVYRHPEIPGVEIHVEANDEKAAGAMLQEVLYTETSEFTIGEG